MDNFHSEHSFEIKKNREEFGLTFSKGAWELFTGAITEWIRRNIIQCIGDEVYEHWACKNLKIKVIIDGEYCPEEKPKGGNNEENRT